MFFAEQMDIENIYTWANIKGINVIGSGDFTHPEWFKHLKENLEQKDNAILVTKNCFNCLLLSFGVYTFV